MFMEYSSFQMVLFYMDRLVLDEALLYSVLYTDYLMTE